MTIHTARPSAPTLLAVARRIVAAHDDRDLHRDVVDQRGRQRSQADLAGSLRDVLEDRILDWRGQRPAGVATGALANRLSVDFDGAWLGNGCSRDTAIGSPIGPLNHDGGVLVCPEGAKCGAATKPAVINP